MDSKQIQMKPIRQKYNRTKELENKYDYKANVRLINIPNGEHLSNKHTTLRVAIQRINRSIERIQCLNKFNGR